jgi:SpoVK/Ycf46/Vps4 family AAA+-type ATPase
MCYSLQARRTILSIHTREWEPKLSQAFINELADYCVGYCGADIKALCTEAALFALRRRYPQVYDSNKKLLLDVNSIEITCKDFFRATKNIVPAFQRSVASPARALSEIIQPLLENTLMKALAILAKIFPQAHTKKSMYIFLIEYVLYEGGKLQQICILLCVVIG